jgi:Cerato-platanin
MIYFTTFILTLLLSHIARATPACGDVASPEELYDPTYADAADGQHVLPIILYNVTWTTKYDNKTGSTKGGACPKLARQYPHYKDFHDFPYIGGAYNVKPPNNQFCGTCWNLTDLKTKKTISLVVLDSAKTGYNISKEAFIKLNGGKVGTSLQAEAKPVAPHFCKIPK